MSEASSWCRTNLALIALAVVLVLATGFFAVQGIRTDPAQARVEKSSQQFTAVRTAAKDEVVAFLTVNYKDMAPLMAKVLEGATGPFKEQYSGAKSNLEDSATKALAVSTGKVRSVGVGELTAKTATVFVAADSQVINKSTSNKAQPRYYRLQLTMVKQHGNWLTSDLKFVG